MHYPPAVVTADERRTTGAGNARQGTRCIEDLGSLTPRPGRLISCDDEAARRPPFHAGRPRRRGGTHFGAGPYGIDCGGGLR